MPSVKAKISSFKKENLRCADYSKTNIFVFQSRDSNWGGGGAAEKVPNDTPSAAQYRKRKETVGTLKLSNEEFTFFIRTVKLKFRLAF